MQTTPNITEVFFGITTETPCDSTQTAYADARYYLTRAATPYDPTIATYDASGIGTSVASAQTVQLNVIQASCITATNLAELPPDYAAGVSRTNFGSHLIQAGTMVLVYGLRDVLRPHRKWYVFSQQSTRLFKLVASATKAGTYTANPWYPSLTNFNHSTGGTFAQSDLGTAGMTVVYLVNQRETGVAGHALSAATQPNVFVGDLMGNDVADGKAIFSINECQ